jgi:integrase
LPRWWAPRGHSLLTTAPFVAAVPKAISDAGERIAFHSIEFFTARLPNVNTRAAYGRAVAALLAVMLYDFVRVGAVVRMSVRDFQENGTTAWLVLREKGGKERRLPAHHLVRQYVREYLDIAGLSRRELARAPLFQSLPGAQRHFRESPSTAPPS